MAKKVTLSQPVKPTTQTAASAKTAEKIVICKQDNNVPQSKPKQTVTRAKPQSKKEEDKTEIPTNKIVNNVRRSLEVEKSDESSLYISALESLPEESKRLSRASSRVSVEFQFEVQTIVN